MVADSSSKTRFVTIGADIGGTFTDVVVIDELKRSIYSTKILTTPEEPELAVLRAVDEMLSLTSTVAANIRILVHGTTLATNAIIERKGARTLLLTTKGFRDALETRDELRYDLHDLFIEYPQPLVPRRRRLGISERVLYNGSVKTVAAKNEISEALECEYAEGVESIAICFLHSYANPANENRAKIIVEKILPDIPISLSSEVLPEIGEYARVSTTVANAYVQPLMNRYLEKLDSKLAQKGLTGAFFVMGSNAGTLSLDIARKHPVRLVESGPAAGVSIAAHYARAKKIQRLLSFDMGGTTAKIALLKDYNPTRAAEFEVARISRFQKGSGLLLKTPAVELIEIGAGGGSLASVDALGLLSVGPESAGSSPGPACYGQGGKLPSVTDADVALGYLNPNYFLGGKMQLDRNLALATIDQHVASPMSVTNIQAAANIFEVVNDNMANAAAIYSAEQGIDLRSYTLMAFGGAAPAHAWDVARRLGISEVRIPFAAGVLSALGCLTSPMSFDFAFGYMRELNDVDWLYVNRRFRELKNQGQEQLKDAGIKKDLTITFSVDMRYYGQRYEVSVPLSEPPFDGISVDKITGDFYAAYRGHYGRKIDDVPVEAVTWRVNVSGPRPKLNVKWPSGAGESKSADPKGQRNAIFAGLLEPVSCSVFERRQLPVGAKVSGPAIIEDTESTTIVPPGGEFHIDDQRMIVINISKVSA